jgi:serine/threonine-protein kinase
MFQAHQLSNAMPQSPKSETKLDKHVEDRLAQALINRGLVTREEVQHCRSGAGRGGGPEALLARLVEARFLTSSQARRAVQEMSAFVEQQIPGFHLVEKLGQGTMGIVYKAQQLSMDRLVAIKVLQPRLADNPEFLERFQHEAHVAARLSHNNVVQAYDVGSAGSLHYFVMEYVEGTTIQRELEAGKVYSEQEAVEIVLQVADALRHAHQRHLIHRDIKPANIMLTPDRVAKLADLGLARQAVDRARDEAEKGLMIGTPYYISPEQIRGSENLDIRTDIYSLGATFYHMVTGQQPFRAKKLDEVLDAHLEKELVPPDHLNTDLSSGLGEVIEFMMAKERTQRYPTPDDLIVDLECLLAGKGPQFARQRIEAARLEELAQGEREDDEATEADRSPRGGISPVWVALLGVLLGLSLLVNLILLLWKR